MEEIEVEFSLFRITIVNGPFFLQFFLPRPTNEQMHMRQWGHSAPFKYKHPYRH